MKNKNVMDNKENLNLLSIFIENIETHSLFFDKHMAEKNEYCCIMIVKKGFLVVQGQRNTSLVLKPLEAMLLPADAEILLKNRQREACEWMTICIGGNGAANMFRYLNIQYMERFYTSGNAIGEHVNRIVQKYSAGEYFWAAIHLQSLLITIKDSSQTNYRVSNLEEIYCYIQAHFEEPMDLTQLANIYGTSVSYFSRMFKQYYKMTPMAFVNAIRIQHAKVLLETTLLKIQEISEKCGFDKMEYFCYVFKKREGCTPSQYRANRENVLIHDLEKSGIE